MNRIHLSTLKQTCTMHIFIIPGIDRAEDGNLSTFHLRGATRVGIYFHRLDKIPLYASTRGTFILLPILCVHTVARPPAKQLRFTRASSSCTILWSSCPKAYGTCWWRSDGTCACHCRDRGNKRPGIACISRRTRHCIGTFCSCPFSLPAKVQVSWGKEYGGIYSCDEQMRIKIETHR